MQTCSDARQRNICLGCRSIRAGFLSHRQSKYLCLSVTLVHSDLGQTYPVWLDSTQSIFNMHLKLGLSLLTATVWLASAGPFTIRWFSGDNCDNPSLACRDYGPYHCCGEPPSPSSFPSMYAFSAGPPGILVFTEVSNTGDCGLCTDTGSLDTCYFNAPFKTAFVASISQCRHVDARNSSSLTSKARIPAFERHAECNETVPIDTATINDHDYDVTGPESERMQIMADVLDLTAGEFAAKWASKYRGPATSGTPTTLLTVWTPSANTA